MDKKYRINAGLKPQREDMNFVLSEFRQLKLTAIGGEQLKIIAVSFN
jgi:hypothetical protein